MGSERKKQLKILWLVVALVVVLAGSIIFVGAVSGWFDDERVTLSEEYVCSDECGEMITLTADEYERLAEEKKSFIVFIDQGGCTTADRMRDFMKDWSKSAGVRVYKMMFGEVKKTKLHEYIKYYPSVALISRGRVSAWLRADDDADADIYNDYEVFRKWLEEHLDNNWVGATDDGAVEK